MAKLTFEEELADQEFERVHRVKAREQAEKATATPTEHPDPADDSDEALVDILPG